MTHLSPDLAAFGWSPHFQSQLSLDDWDRLLPARVVAVHRSGFDVLAPGLEARIGHWGDDDENRATIGDWLLLDPATRRPERLLRRRSLFQRKAAGTANRVQLIAANVDTAFVVSSCNLDFNPARLERYLALAKEAEVEPVVILTKADLTDDPGSYSTQAAALAPSLLVETCNAHDPTVIDRLRPWLGAGQTVALLGSSGVGKSTLINTLIGGGRLATAPIREDDAKGRHTTSGRSLHRLASGGWLVDTPGMREIQLTDAEGGIEGLFADIVALEGRCRFSNCRHGNEPGCAVQAAIGAGALEPDRLERFQKLQREEALNSRSLAERRAKDRAFGKHVKASAEAKRRKRDLL